MICVCYYCQNLHHWVFFFKNILRFKKYKLVPSLISSKRTLQLRLNSCFRSLFLSAIIEKTGNEILYSKMSVEHILTNNSSGTVGCYEKTSGDSWLYLWCYWINNPLILLGNARATNWTGSRFGSNSKKELQPSSSLPQWLLFSFNNCEH